MSYGICLLHMKAQEVIDYYGSIAAVATELGLQKQAVWKWKKRGMVPPLSAARLHDLTRGKLRFDPADYSGWYDKSKPKSVELVPDVA